MLRQLGRSVRGFLQVPRVLGYSRPHRTVLIEPISGRSIGEQDGDGLLDGLRAYGAAIASLHSLPVPDVPVSSRPPIERLARRTRGLGTVRPDVEEEGTRLLAALSDRLVDSVDESVLVHGDANASNAILCNGHVTLIDFDRAAPGPPASDIGSYLSLLAHSRALGDISTEDEMARADAFLDGYSSLRPLPARESLTVHLSASLAERAVGAVYRVRSKALAHLPDLLAEAREALG
jgi:Ser/Thr protein kinase RdoA (MazF antagonist)